MNIFIFNFPHSTMVLKYTDFKKLKINVFDHIDKHKIVGFYHSYFSNVNAKKIVAMSKDHKFLRKSYYYILLF